MGVAAILRECGSALSSAPHGDLAVGGRPFFSKGIAMLVLTRKVGESIRVGADVRIIVTKISGDRVRLVFDAPKSVSIVRTEIANEKP